MPTYFPLMTRSNFWGRAALVIGLVMAASLAGCANFSSVTVSEGENQKAFIKELTRTPAVCQGYRQAYVSGFKDHVKALAANDADGQSQSRQRLSHNSKKLSDSGFEEADCFRPYCIIKPMQNGRLDSWCGYRLDADEGTDLYQWLAWEEVQTALQSL